MDLRLGSAGKTRLSELATLALEDPFPSGVKLAWAMPHDMSLISTATHHSLMVVARPEKIWYLTVNKGGDLAIKRELQIEAALKAGCTHVWLLDGDMVYPSDILIRLFRLLKDGADLAGGLCFRGHPPWEPIAKHLTEPRNMLPFRDFEFGDVIRPRATGAACLLVKREVFESIDQPWFKITLDPLSPIKVKQSEDVYFTQKATEAGFKLWIDTAINVDHVREIGINREFYLVHLLAVRLSGNDRLKKMVVKSMDPKWLERVLDPVLE